MSSLPTITDEDDPAYALDPANWLPNPHAGDMLWLEFMEPLELTAQTLAPRIETDAAAIQRVIDGQARIDGELDLRLTRYFRMSEGFFLRLQDGHELLEAKRALGAELDRIVPRAA